MNTHCVSSVPQYFHQQDPNRFGGDQQEYEQTCQKIVDEAATEIAETRESKTNLRGLFSTLFERFNKARHESEIIEDTRYEFYYGCQA